MNRDIGFAASRIIDKIFAPVLALVSEPKDLQLKSTSGWDGIAKKRFDEADSRDSARLKKKADADDALACARLAPLTLTLLWLRHVFSQPCSSLHLLVHPSSSPFYFNDRFSLGLCTLIDRRFPRQLHRRGHGLCDPVPRRTPSTSVFLPPFLPVPLSCDSRSRSSLVHHCPFFTCRPTRMVGLVSAAGLVGLLSEPDPELRSFALKQLDGQVDLLWTEIANSVGEM